VEGGLILALLLLSLSPAEPIPHHVGARRGGMGNAGVAAVGGAESLFWNPAAIPASPGVSLFGQMKLNRSDFGFDPKGIAFTWRRIGLGWGNKIAVGLKGTPDYNYYAAALKLSWRAGIGIALKFKRRHPCHYYQFFGERTYADLGIIFFPSERLSFGIVLPLGEGAAIAGGALSLPSLLTAFDLAFKGLSPSPHVGVELRLGRGFRLRAGGWAFDPSEGEGISIGAGFSNGHISIDYAFLRGETSAHYISAELRSTAQPF